MLLRKPCEQGLHKMRANRDSTGSGPISAPPCRSALFPKIHPSLDLKSCRYMDTGSGMPSTPSAEWTNLGKSQFLRHGGQLQRTTSWMASSTQESLPMPRPTPDWTDVSPGSSKPTAWKTLRSNKKRPSHSASSTPSSPQHPSPPIPKPVRSPTWSNWASTSASDHVNTPSALTTAE